MSAMSRLKIRSVWLPAGLALAAASVSSVTDADAAPCVARFADDIATERTLAFDPLHETPMLSHAIGLINDEAAACPARLEFRIVEFSANWPEERMIHLRTAAGDSVLTASRTDHGAGSGTVMLTVPPDGRETLRLVLELSSGNQPLSSGDYRVGIEVQLWPVNQAGDTPAKTRRLDIGFRAQPSVRLSLAEFTHSTVISLGELRPRARERFGVMVTATEAYTLVVNSANNWWLRHVDNGRTGDDRVPYRFMVDGDAVKPGETYRKHFHTLRGGTRVHSFTAEVGEFDFVRYGQYRDVINIIVSVKM